MILKMKAKIDDGCFKPTIAHRTDGGLDLKTPCDFTVKAGETVKVNTGVHIQIPEGYMGLVLPKSGLNVNYNLDCLGLVDAEYTGGIVVALRSHNDFDVEFKKGDKVGQIAFVPVRYPELEYVDELDKTERGDNGFGSTGR